MNSELGNRIPCSKVLEGVNHTEKEERMNTQQYREER